MEDHVVYLQSCMYQYSRAIYRSIKDLIDPYHARNASRLTVEGDELAIGAESVTPLALVFHELATNAVKYGALSAEDGRVTVGVRRQDDDVILDWIEQGGPAVAGPNQTSGLCRKPPMFRSEATGTGFGTLGRCLGRNC